jgi:peptidyl-prolyl cis-trans isomerase SurA
MALLTVLGQVGTVAVAHAEVVDRIVAVVNDDIITMSELQNMAKTIEAQSGVKANPAEDKKLQREMLEALIDRKLAKAEAKRRGIAVTNKEVTESLERFKQRNNIPDDEILAKLLANEGLSLKEFKQQIGDQMVQERLLSVTVGSKVTLNEAEVRRIYDERFKRSGSQVRLVTVRMPFAPGSTDAQKEETRHKAEAILKQVKRGESFMEAAKKHGLNPTDVGFVSLNDLDPRLAEYLGHLKSKEVAPVETPEGFQLIQIIERRSGEPRPFEEVAPEIRRILSQQEMEKKFAEWVKVLRDKAHIRIML